MQRYLIEITHGEKKEECLKAIEVFKNTGSHLLKNADWGCPDHIHKAWITVETDSKEEALSLVPPWYRDKTQIITLEKFALQDMDKEFSYHQ